VTDCLFCGIASGEIDSYTIYEDDDVRAFLDTHPLTLGHTVVVPKEHVKDIIDMKSELIGPVFSGVKKATEMLAHALGAENFTIGINHGRMLGHPDINHMHIHVIPRFEGDGGGDIHSIVKYPPEEGLKVTRKKILDANELRS
jgi:histidine triad (HIT) family protein